MGENKVRKHTLSEKFVSNSITKIGLNMMIFRNLVIQSIKIDCLLLCVVIKLLKKSIS